MGGHARSLSFGRDRASRGSWSQKQMKEMMDGNGGDSSAVDMGREEGGSPPPVPSIPGHFANSGGEHSRGSSPVDGRKSPEAYRAMVGAAPGSPEQLRRSAGSPPTTGGGGHRHSGESVLSACRRLA